MRITISFKHLEHTEALDSRIKEKSQKIGKYMSGKTDLGWTCYVKDGLHYAECKLNGPRFNYHATAKSDSLYKTVDLVLEKLEKQIVKKKEKWKGRRHDVGHTDLTYYEPEVAWQDRDDTEEAA